MEVIPPVPARMLNEVAYCPRLFALEWLNREWADSADTVEGRTVHRGTDVETVAGLPEPDDDGRPRVLRSVLLGDEALGIVARIDLVEADGGEAVPVDYKKGSPPDLPEGAWEPERVQLCAQGLLLRAHGYRCEHGFIWFAETRRRVEVRFDGALVARTLELRDVARAIATEAGLPPPLRDSPKCDGCSLVGICLPDEHYALLEEGAPVRPLYPARDDGMPLYVRLQGGSLSKDGEEIVVRERGKKEVARARIAETSRVAVLGNVTVTTPLLRELAYRDIPVAFHGHSGWFFGSFAPSTGRNVMTRIAQHRAAADPQRSLALARSFVHAKILNSRVLLRRNGEDVPDDALLRLNELAADATRAESLDSLFGIEGMSARLYFEQFSRMVKTDMREAFAMDGRNRRPPRDAVNALLSFAYACLVRELTVILGQIGFDPYVGFLHQPRYGRPALPLDLMEEFRPIIADSVVINAINNEVVQAGDFLVRPTGVSLSDGARTRFIGVYERRMDELATHPTFGTRLSYRRILEVQGRLLGKVLLGELPAYPEYRVR